MKLLNLRAARAAACLVLFLTVGIPSGASRLFAQTVAPEHGPADAIVTIVEFADFTSEPSGRLAFMLETLATLYPKDVRIVFKHNPDASKVVAVQAHVAALSADAQGKFWQMADVLFANQQRLKGDDLIRMAAQAGLDPQRFAADVESGRLEGVVESDRQEAANAGLRGAGCVLNGRRLTWPLTLQALKAAVDDAINSARR